MAIQWDHIIAQVVTVAGPIIGYMWKNRRDAKKDAQARYDESKRTTDQRHIQNQQKLDDLLTERNEERRYGYQHYHADVNEQGPLMIEHLRHKPNGVKEG